MKPHISFVGVGVPQSATTWIARCLNEHPKLCLSSRKETGFFIRKKVNYISYGEFWGHCEADTLKGEFTPKYLYSAVARERIKNAYPDTKIIICLRNPITRAYSHFNRFRKRGVPVVSDNGKTLHSFNDVILYPKTRLVAYGLYFEHVRLYKKLFGDKVHVAIFEDIHNNPRLFLREIYSFLGVDSGFVPQSLNQKINIADEGRALLPVLNTALYRMAPLFRFSRLSNRGFKLFMHLVLKTNINTGTGVKRKGIGEYPKAIKFLLNYYNDDIYNLEKLLERSLKHWKDI